MAVPHNSVADGAAAAEETNRPAEVSASADASSSNPTKSPVVRNLHGRVYDSENGKTCHQCRQKTTDFSAPCTQIRRNKPCPIKFCRKCLLNRYGEKAEVVALLENWICPKCRGVCNCSLCMKKKGQQPTGILIHTAKATGYSSVHEFLYKQGSDVLNAAHGLRSLSTANPDVCREVNSDGPVPMNCSNGSTNDIRVSDNERNNDIQKDVQTKKVKAKHLKKEHKSRRCDKDIHVKYDNLATIAPRGIPLTKIAGAEWAAADVGAALQFLEFCNSFSEALDINKGEPESVLRELARGCVGRRGMYSSIVMFHIKLLSFIQKDMGDMSSSPSTTSGDQWLESVIKCITESECALKSPLDVLKKGSLEYDNWDPSHKLRLLNLLCDRTLETEELRKWIDEENKKYIERKKEAKETIIAAKKKGKVLKKKMKDGVAKAMVSLREGPPLSVADHDNVLSQIRAEKEKVHAEMLEIMEQVPKDSDNIRRDALRTEPLLLEGEGHVYWKLGGGCHYSKIIHQDIGCWDSVISGDKWFTYDEEEEKSVEKHISSLR
ncbi:hypothetical protein Cni_G06423 [Canna indica]|uniref:DDT domain-containing protein n=1 Tax=Canna indica TaxID=4628 RepID=A0AAQ3K1H8_9LILI|nr:hypothetical protein Cni_G06423 [Canna indica]